MSAKILANFDISVKLTLQYVVNCSFETIRSSNLARSGRKMFRDPLFETIQLLGSAESAFF